MDLYVFQDLEKKFLSAETRFHEVEIILLAPELCPVWVNMSSGILLAEMTL